MLAPDQRREHHRYRTAALPLRVRRGPVRRGSRAGGRREPLAQKQSQIIADQPGQVARGPERTVGVTRDGLDVGDHRRELRLPLGRWLLEVQQSGQRVRKSKLVLETRDVHSRSDPSVALPVQADEDVGLRQVRPVELLRWVRSSPEFEHQRREPQAGDRPRNSLALGREFGQRRADEYAQPLVGRADRSAAPARSSCQPDAIRVGPSRATGHARRQRVAPARRPRHLRPERSVQRCGSRPAHGGLVARLATREGDGRLRHGSVPAQRRGEQHQPWDEDSWASFSIVEGNGLFGIGCSIGPVGATVRIGDSVSVSTRVAPVLGMAGRSACDDAG